MHPQTQPPSLLLAWNLRDSRVVVAAGEALAAHLVDLLLQAGAEVVLVAPGASDGLTELAELELIEWRPRTVRESDLDGAHLVFAASDDAPVDDLVGWARTRGIPVHVHERPEASDFDLPASFREGPVQVAVSTPGAPSHTASRILRLLRAALPAEAPAAVERLGRWQAGLRERVRDRGERALKTARQSRLPWSEAAQIGEEPRERGRLTLVGAGPGDPGLLTARALDALTAADLVVADPMVPAGLLHRLDAEVRVARELPGSPKAGERELHRWIHEALAAGKQVVHLASGDPLVFASGLQVLQQFRAQGVEVDVVAGVTSALAAPLSVGIPLTSEAADRVTLITDRGPTGAPVTPPDFDPAGTLIWLTALDSLDRLAIALITEHGYPTNWPVAVVERATQPGQRAVRAPLHAIAQVVRDQGLSAPAAIVMGSVVRQAHSAAFEADVEDTCEVRVAG